MVDPFFAEYFIFPIISFHRRSFSGNCLWHCNIQEWIIFTWYHHNFAILKPAIKNLLPKVPELFAVYKDVTFFLKLKCISKSCILFVCVNVCPYKSIVLSTNIFYNQHLGIHFLYFISVITGFPISTPLHNKDCKTLTWSSVVTQDVISVAPREERKFSLAAGSNTKIRFCLSKWQWQICGVTSASNEGVIYKEKTKH